MTQQTVTIPKPIFDELITRLERLEKTVFKKNNIEKTLHSYKDEKQKGKLKKLQLIDELFT